MSVKRPKIIFGERQPVADLTPEGEPGQPGNRKCPHHLVAESESPSGLRGEGAGEAFGALLFCLDEAAQARFIIVEGLPISPSGRWDVGARVQSGRFTRTARGRYSGLPQTIGAPRAVLASTRPLPTTSSIR